MTSGSSTFATLDPGRPAVISTALGTPAITLAASATSSSPATLSTTTIGHVTTPTTEGASTDDTTTKGAQFSTYTTFIPLPSSAICAKSYKNPTYTPPAPLPTDYTWGCPPGYLCHPPKPRGCIAIEGPPDSGYVCDPSQCLPTAPLKPLQYWGQPIVSNETEKYTLQDDYINLDPEHFGLGFDIFLEEVVVVVALGGNESSSDVVSRERSRLVRRAETAPPMCYDDCNACILEAESTGKSPTLCLPTSAFVAAVSDCQSCITLHSTSSSPNSYQQVVQPDFQQFLNFCSGTGLQSAAPDVVSAAGAGSGPQSEVAEGASSAGSIVSAVPAVPLVPGGEGGDEGGDEGGGGPAMESAGSSTVVGAGSGAATSFGFGGEATTTEGVGGGNNRATASGGSSAASATSVSSSSSSSSAKSLGRGRSMGQVALLALVVDFLLMFIYA
ncbi:MAG: hypothetical protein M1827_004008 [Pycnora praestabilis]|nr:MAG: hypothetical protein M1827_004008 [Pycnora praestabilis]